MSNYFRLKSLVAHRFVFIELLFSSGWHSWKKNKNKYSKFDKWKSISYQEHNYFVQFKFTSRNSAKIRHFKAALRAHWQWRWSVWRVQQDFNSGDQSREDIPHKCGMTKSINYVNHTKQKKKSFSFEGTLDDLMLYSNTKDEVKWVILK